MSVLQRSRCCRVKISWHGRKCFVKLTFFSTLEIKTRNSPTFPKFRNVKKIIFLKKNYFFPRKFLASPIILTKLCYSRRWLWAMVKKHDPSKSCFILDNFRFFSKFTKMRKNFFWVFFAHRNFSSESFKTSETLTWWKRRILKLNMFYLRP